MLNNWEKWHKFLFTLLFGGSERLHEGYTFFISQLKNDPRTKSNIRKITTGQGDDYTAYCLLDYPYFTEHYKMIAIDLSKQQVLDADSKVIQQINLSESLDRDGNTMFFIIQEAKETILDFSQGPVRVL